MTIDTFDTLPVSSTSSSFHFNDLSRVPGEIAVASVLLYPTSEMLKISIVDTRGLRRLVLEGKLLRPWTNEVQSAWKIAGEQLGGRKLVVDLANVTLITPEGENVLLELIQAGAKFSCEGVFTRHLLRELIRKRAGLP